MSYQPIEVDAYGRASFVWPHSSEIDIRAAATKPPSVLVALRGLSSELDPTEAVIIGRWLIAAGRQAGGAA